MSSQIGLQKILVHIALRNVALHKVKSFTIGALLAFATLLLVVGLTLLLNIERAMETSITQSLAGHLQLYSNKAKDSLALFGGSFMGREEVGSIPDYGPLREKLVAMPFVKGVMPMGIDTAILPKGNTLDKAFEQLRLALKNEDAAQLQETVNNVKFQIAQLHEELDAGKRISGSTGEAQQQLEILKRAEEPEFWSELQTKQNESLEYLEAKIAPLAGEPQPLYMRYVGIDPETYPTLFPKFKLASGNNIPRGERGLLLSQKVNEDFFKNYVARLFDKIHKKLSSSGKKIAGDDETQRFANDLPRQYQQILLYLSGAEVAQLLPKLKSIVGKVVPELNSTAQLLQEFLKVNDENFIQRHEFFYQEIAPLIELYPLKPGDTAIVRAYTRSGYVRTLPVKVYGVFTFDGLENSDLSGGFSLLDLVTFRDLYGAVDESSQAENNMLLERSGITQLTAENAEGALFGGDSDESTATSATATSSTATSSTAILSTEAASTATAASTAATINSTDVQSENQPLQIKQVASTSYPPEALQKGLALNVAVVLNPGVSLEEAIKNLAPVADEFDLKIVDWKEASGIVGQFATIVRAVLLVGVGVVLLVALLIINNSLVVSTLQRVKEIGTMRAIGAQRSFVRELFLWETGSIALLGSTCGVLIASAILLWMRSVGIPAGHAVVEFLFSGARLYPSFSVPVIFLVPLVVVLLSVISSLYAANYASKITPAEAMQEKE